MKRLSGDSGIKEAVARLRRGDIVALPTETVYGLAGDAANDDAVRAIFAAKGRPADHPLIVHVASAADIERWANPVPAAALKLAEAFWPGPLTVLLKRASHVSTVVTGGRDTIAIRSPAQSAFHRILTLLDTGLAAPSANPYKQLSPTTADQVIESMAGRIDAVFDGGPCEYGLESTIVDLTGSTPTILRAGPVTRAQLAAELDCDVALPAAHQVAVPGNVQAHYQPGKPLYRLSTARLIKAGIRAGFLIWSDDAAAAIASHGVDTAQVIRLPAEPVGYGRGLYSALHQLDHCQIDEIRVEQPPADDHWAAVNDRLRRAEG